MQDQPRRRPWLILAAGFATFGVSASLMHGYSVYLLAFIAEFGWSRAESSIAYAVGQVVAGVSSPLVGLLVDRIGTARMVALGGVLMTAGLFASAHADALWQVVLLYGVVMTMGANCVSMVVFGPLISRLFLARRGAAIAVLQSANGFGRAVSAPVAQLMVNGLGWRGAYWWQGIAMAVMALPLALLFRGAERAPAAAGTASGRQWRLQEAMRTRHFWLLSLVYMLTSIGSFLVALHQVAFAVGKGFDPLYAASIIGIGALLALPGSILTGALSDVIGRELSSLLAYLISIIGVGCALFIDNGDQHALFWAHCCFFGITWGARGPAITAKTADLFPGPRLGTILGVITIGSGLGAGIGSWAAGLLFDLTGAYTSAFVISILAYAGGAWAFMALRKPITPV